MLCVFQNSSVDKFVLPQEIEEILTSENFTDMQDDGFSSYADKSVRVQEYVRLLCLLLPSQS
jgi:hypothetical protein